MPVGLLRQELERCLTCYLVMDNLIAVHAKTVRAGLKNETPKPHHKWKLVLVTQPRKKDRTADPPDSE